MHLHELCLAMCGLFWGTLASTTTSSIGSQQLMEEVEEYFHAPARLRLENLFLLWKNFAEVPVIVQASLATPLSASNPSVRKRLFSSTDNFVTTRREHLLPKHVEQFVFIHCNMH